MGLDIHGTRFLLYARRLDVDFARTALIGRQSLRLGRRDLRDSFRAFGYDVSQPLMEAIFTKCDGYAEPLFTCLGAREVHSFDNSAYEGATHLHDMNRELTTSMKEQYTVVLDGGSLEHVFNLPTAIKNCMEMVRVGGHYLGITPANNFLGHGFYQFSPELYFSVFTRENGFELTRLVAFEDRPRATWYAVRSPREVRGRVTLVNRMPVYLLIVAKKLAATTVFATIPQQSDYLAAWDQHQGIGSGPSTKRVSQFYLVRRRISAPLKQLLRNIRRRFTTEFDPRFFQPFDPASSRQSPPRPLQEML